MTAYVWHEYPIGGWASHGVPTRLQRNDQGKDVEIAWGHHVTAPGYGRCIAHYYDGPWPFGFGSPYAIVQILGNSSFAGGPNNGCYYVGHANGWVIPVGSWFHTGQAIALPNHSENSGWGWVEIGRVFSGRIARFGDGALIAHKFVPVWKKGL